MSAAHLAFVVAIIAVAAVIQAVSGFGFSLASMPLLAALLGVDKALAIQTTLGIVSNATTAWRGRPDILRDTATRMLTAMVFGMPFGWLLLEHVSNRNLKLLVGVVVAVIAVLLALRFTIRSTGPAVDYISGFFSGVLSTSTGTNGPPLVIGLSGRRLPAAQQRATLSTCFTIANIVVFAALLWSGRIDRSVAIAVAAAIPGLLAGSVIGHRIFGRLHQHHYERIVIALLIASATIAIISAIIG